MYQNQVAIAARVLAFMGDFLRALVLAGTGGVAFHNTGEKVNTTYSAVEVVGNKRRVIALQGVEISRSRAVALWKLGTANLCGNSGEIFIRPPSVLRDMEGVCRWLGWVRQGDFTVAVSAFAEIHDLLLAVLSSLSSSDETMAVVESIIVPEHQSSIPNNVTEARFVVVRCKNPSATLDLLEKIMRTSGQTVGILRANIASPFTSYAGESGRELLLAITVENLDWKDNRPANQVGPKIWGIAFVAS